MRHTKPTFIRRNFIRTAVLLGVWIWALHGIARGDDAAPVVLPNTPVVEAGAEHFVPHVTPIECTGTIQMLRSAAVTGNDIRVRDVARWSDADSVGFSAIADLVIDHFYDGNNRRLSLDEVRSTLTGAGVNLSQVNFAGSRSCLITHSDAPAAAIKTPKDDREVVQQWLNEKDKPVDGLPTAKPVAEIKPEVLAVTADTQFHSLRDTIILDLAQRLNVPADDLQVTFDPKDRSFLNLTEPLFHFELTPRRLTDLGKVSWDVTVGDGKSDRKLTINADARAWERQLVVGKGISYRQVLRDTDFTERRVLVDRLENDPLLTRTQIVGQQAARDLKPGMVLTARMLDPVPLVKQGDFVTVTLNCGGVQIRTVATAMEAGSYGQTIKVKSEQNQSVYVVTMTGPQEAVMGPAAVKVDSVASVGK